MSDYGDRSSQARPVTVGVSIAVVLIFLIAIFHVWRYIFKKIKKKLNPVPLEAVVTEIPVPHPERRVSAMCIQKLEMVLQYDDDIDMDASVSDHPLQRHFIRSVSDSAVPSKGRRKRTLKRKRHSVTYPRSDKTITEEDRRKVTLFAGYTHRHINDA